MIVLKKYLLEFAVFICGAVVMIFELAGSRIFAPYFGSSIFVWTSLIGIILGFLSFGYWFGGKIADKKANFQNFSFLIFISAIFIGLIIVVKDFVLVFFQDQQIDIRWSSFWVSLILFSGPSMVLGMVSPYAVKLKINNLNNSGSTVGNLYAISTLGSIVGTFLAGFVLIPFFGTTRIFVFLFIVLLLLSFVVFPSGILKLKNQFKLFFIYFILMIIVVILFGSSGNFIDINTPYNYVRILDATHKDNQRPIRLMQINAGNHASMFLDGDDLVFEYTKYYDLASHFNPNFKKSLMIGGAAYSYPKYYLKKFPNSEIDVVEIDPDLTKLAKKYFDLKEDPRLKIYHEDGRVFLNKTANKYDVVFGDAFTSYYEVPHHLATKEAVQKTYDILNQNGVVLINIISAVGGYKSEFLRAEYATYKSIFPQVYVLPIMSLDDPSVVQNIMLVALKTDQKPSFSSDDVVLDGYLKHLWTQEIKEDLPILTDDYAPIDYYMSKTI